MHNKTIKHVRDQMKKWDEVDDPETIEMLIRSMPTQESDVVLDYCAVKRVNKLGQFDRLRELEDEIRKEAKEEVIDRALIGFDDDDRTLVIDDVSKFTVQVVDGSDMETALEDLAYVVIGDPEMASKYRCNECGVVLNPAEIPDHREEHEQVAVSFELNDE